MLSWLARPFRAFFARLSRNHRARRHRRLRRWAEYHLNQQLDMAERLRDSAQQQLAEAQARLRVLEVELRELYAVTSRNHARVERETAVEGAQQALAENGVALLKPAPPRPTATS